MATAKEIIKVLGDTDWSKDNEAQMKAVQLLKGLSLSEEPISNEFMKLIDKATTEAAKKVLATNESLEKDEEYVVEMKKQKKVVEMEGPCQCTNCDWSGDAEELDNGMCPECGSEVEMIEAKKEDVAPVEDPVVEEKKTLLPFLDFVKEQEKEGKDAK